MAQVEVSQHVAEIAFTDSSPHTDSAPQVEVAQHIVEVAWVEGAGLQVQIGPDFSFIKIVSFFVGLVAGVKSWLS
jgi:hypothetical protein